MSTTVKRLDNVEFTKLVLKLHARAEHIKAAVESGKTTLTEIARDHGVATSTITKALKGMGITPRHGGHNAKEPVLTRNIITVLARVCKELNVEYSEIKPYLD